MPRPPLPIGTWGKIWTYPTHYNNKGKRDRFRAIAKYRDHDGGTIEGHGKSAKAAQNHLRTKLKERAATSTKGELTSMHHFAVAAEMWFDRLATSAAEGRRSPETVRIYRSQMDKHVLPALAEVRLGEVTTPMLDKVIRALKADVGGSTAKTCRSIISGILGLAVRYGALTANPVREVERLELARKEARALTEDERRAWFKQLQADPVAVRKDLPDLTAFMLAPGVRIGEALAVLWSQVDFDAGTVEITHTVIRIKSAGLTRMQTKTRAGGRLLLLGHRAQPAQDHREHPRRGRTVGPPGSRPARARPSLPQGVYRSTARQPPGPRRRWSRPSAIPRTKVWEKCGNRLDRHLNQAPICPLTRRWLPRLGSNQ